MGRIKRIRALAGVLLLAGAAVTSHAQNRQRDIESPRLYVLDGGILASDPARYRLTAAEVEEDELSIASYLVVHRRGVLLWDAGAIADSERAAGGVGVEQRVLRRDGDERFVKLGPPLLEQIRAAGYAPDDITHVALSHYHWDHTAGANAFAHATWLVPTIERDLMFAADPPGGTRPQTYSALRTSETEILEKAEHDVFGDGTVVIRRAPGHTEGHSVLYVKLAQTGGVVLSGDLYHYPAERSLNRVPAFDVSQQATAAARAELEQFLTRTGAALWIQHDLVAHRKLKKSPEYYE